MYWWNETPNFGDGLNPYIVDKLGGAKVSWVPLHEADLVGAGSLLQWVTPLQGKLKHTLHVWGSGYMFDREPAITSPMVVHHAVRGTKSRSYGNLKDVALGDPGLLIDQLLVKRPPKRHRLGIVPHLWHASDLTLTHLLNRYPELKCIDVRQNALDVIREIASCEFIFSSSLHGLVAADSLGIPNQWVAFSQSLFGGTWKFEDYYSLFNGLHLRHFKLQQTTDLIGLAEKTAREYKRPKIEARKEALLKAFPKELVD